MRALVIYKKSAYQRYGASDRQRIDELIAAGDSALQSLATEHDQHQRSVETIKKLLQKLGVKATFRHRPDTPPDNGWDLIVTLGGDGTLLWASHLADSNTPMLAINTAPDSSKGYFCAADVDGAKAVLDDAMVGKLKATKLTRMRISVNEEIVSTRVLNDALFCHESPAVTTRYTIRVDGQSEDQMSSGVWIATAAGSTAAIRSAGGKVLPVGSQKIQYAVREPYRGVDTKYHLLKGTLSPGETMAIHCKTPGGRVFLDGGQKSHSVGIGDRVEFCRSEESLSLLGLRR